MSYNLPDLRTLYVRRAELLPRLRGKVLRACYGVGIVPDSNGRCLRALRDRHQGQRAFIVGNGPSLKTADLTLIKEEISFGSNKVYLGFADTAWRPTYYSVCDKLVAKNNHEVIRGLPLQKYFSDQVKEYFNGADDITWLHETSRNAPIQDHLDGLGPAVPGYFSHDLLAGFDGGWTVVYQQLQMAYYMGITEVVLLGMDFSFTVPEKRVESHVRGYNMQIESSGEVNHFHPDYRKPGEVWGIPRLDCQRFAFGVARAHFERAGRTILNASRASQLDVFPRERLEDVLSRRPFRAA